MKFPTGRRKGICLLLIWTAFCISVFQLDNIILVCICTGFFMFLALTNYKEDDE